MANESERCVDQLLIMMGDINRLIEQLHKQDKPPSLHSEARQVLTSSRSFVENNRQSIPSYSLKRIVETLNKLELEIERPRKQDFKFKFGSKLEPSTGEEQTVKDVSEAHSGQMLDVQTNFCGFRDKTGEKLELGPEEVMSRDVCLSNLNNCEVLIRGLANTIHLRHLKDTKLTICLASRAITVNDCLSCDFNLICQQLRINTTKDCRFNVHTSARSMLEESTGLQFSPIDMGSIRDKITAEEEKEYFTAAGFDIGKNNWRLIDDFDWLSPSAPSKNYKIVE